MPDGKSFYYPCALLASRKLMQMAELDSDAADDGPSEPSPEFLELQKQAAAAAKEERKRLIREAKKRQRIR